MLASDVHLPDRLKSEDVWISYSFRVPDSGIQSLVIQMAITSKR